jgi:hypothetical protein
MRIFTRRRTTTTQTRRRLLTAAALVAGSIGVSLLSAAPATASELPEFFIFYSQNCGGAFHFYSGANSGERWINDTFNEGSGLAGYGQKIAYNAASVKVWPGTWVEIDYDNAYQAFYVAPSSTIQCVNLSPATRNDNYDWADGS